jgi:hypothetical protein
MREVTTKVYTFDELSDRAKERARDWYREGMETDDYADSVIEDAARLGAIIGIDLRQKPVKLMNGSTRMEPLVYWSGFSSQGGGLNYGASYAWKRGSVKALASEAPMGDDKTHRGNNTINRIAQELQTVQRRNFYQLQASISPSGRYFSLDIDVERADCKTVSDNDVEIVQECLRDFGTWIYRQLESEYEYQTSDEQVDESIEANEYTFDEDGNRKG